MDGQAILAVGTVVGLLCTFARRNGLSGRWSTIFVVLASLLCVVVWGYSNNTFARETAWDYLAGWASIMLSAGGIFHGIEELPKTQIGQATGTAVTAMRNMTGTGTGDGGGSKPPTPPPPPPHSDT